MLPALVWSEDLLAYDFGPGHPMDPLRLRLTRDLVASLRLDARLSLLSPRIADDDELALVHEPAYIAGVRAASEHGTPDVSRGLGAHGEEMADTPVFPGMHEAAARLVGGTIEAVRAVAGGRAPRAVFFAGGMHHAMPGAAAGFCVYNDAAVAIADHLARGGGDVVYIDLDVHHGDGVERAFAQDPRVTCVSVHQHPRSLFPHTGYSQDVACGNAVNLPLPEDVDDSGWVRAVEAVVEPVLREVRPSLVVSQHGADPHRNDPLGGLGLSVEALTEGARLIRSCAERFSGGRWVALGGGGYDVADAVPRAWAALVAVVADVEVPAALGDGAVVRWRPYAEGHDPADRVDRAITATRNAAFPNLGLDPLTA